MIRAVAVARRREAMAEILGATIKNGVVGFLMAALIALVVPSIKLVVVDALLASGPKVPIIGIRWGLPEFIIGGILGALAAKIIWSAFLGAFVKDLFDIT